MSIIFHELEPFYNKDSEILILGSLPSVKSREMKFYYAHPQNRFWNTLAKVYKEPKPNTTKEAYAMGLSEADLFAFGKKENIIKRAAAPACAAAV